MENVKASPIFHCPLSLLHWSHAGGSSTTVSPIDVPCQRATATLRTFHPTKPHSRSMWAALQATARVGTGSMRVPRRVPGRGTAASMPRGVHSSTSTVPLGRATGRR
jgi:hypothetical protein